MQKSLITLFMVVAITAAVTIKSDSIEKSPAKPVLKKQDPTKPLPIKSSAIRAKPPKETKYFNLGAKSLDYKVQGKKDEHRFGVELKENKQFHHTKTEEDGVRLGCYGHIQDGKKYSTHYVADGKGYRLVPHQGLITVYPKEGEGEPRKASFVQSFNEDEIRSANIRYFFPDGCQIGVAEDQTPTIPPILVKDEAVEVPTTTVEPETTTTPTTEEEVATTVLPETITTTTVAPTTVAPQENCFVRCCDDDKARIVLSPTKTGISKIVLPFDTELLNRCSVEEIIEITSEKDNIVLLKKLLKFAQRYKL